MSFIHSRYIYFCINKHLNSRGLCLFYLKNPMIMYSGCIIYYQSNNSSSHFGCSLSWTPCPGSPTSSSCRRRVNLALIIVMICRCYILYLQSPQILRKVDQGWNPFISAKCHMIYCQNVPVWLLNPGHSHIFRIKYSASDVGRVSLMNCDCSWNIFIKHWNLFRVRRLQIGEIKNQEHK